MDLERPQDNITIDSNKDAHQTTAPPGLHTKYMETNQLAMHTSFNSAHHGQLKRKQRTQYYFCSECFHGEISSLDHSLKTLLFIHTQSRI